MKRFTSPAINLNTRILHRFNHFWTIYPALPNDILYFTSEITIELTDMEILIIFRILSLSLRCKLYLKLLHVPCRQIVCQLYVIQRELKWIFIRGILTIHHPVPLVPRLCLIAGGTPIDSQRYNFFTPPSVSTF